jgi:hypothetical protein
MSKWFEQFNQALNDSNIEQAKKICVESTWQDAETIYSKNLYNKLNRQSLNISELQTLRYANRAISRAAVTKDGQELDTVYLNFETDDKGQDLLGSWDGNENAALAYLDGLFPLVCNYSLYERTSKAIEGFKGLESTYNITSKIRGIADIYDDKELERIAAEINHPPNVLTETNIFQLMDDYKGFEIESSIFIERIHRGIVKLTHPDEGDLYVNVEHFDEWKIIGGGCMPMISSLVKDFKFSQQF